MIDEIVIWRTAKAMVDVEGDKAALYASQRVNSLLESGDTDGAAVWYRIKKAILELQILAPSKRHDA